MFKANSSLSAKVAAALVVASSLIGLAGAQEAQPSFASEQYSIALDATAQCLRDKTSLAAKSDLSDTAATDFVVSACIDSIETTSLWRCTSGLDGSNPLFAAIFNGASNPLQLCQDVYNEKDREGFRTLAMTEVLTQRYE